MNFHNIHNHNRTFRNTPCPRLCPLPGTLRPPCPRPELSRPVPSFPWRSVGSQAGVMRPRPSAILLPGRSVPASWPLACVCVPLEGVLRTLPSAWRPRCSPLRVGPEERPWLSLVFPWRPDAELRPCIYGHGQSSLKRALQMSLSIGMLTLPVDPQDGSEDARARASQHLAPRSHWPPWQSLPSLCFPPSHTLSGGGRERLGRDRGGGGGGVFQNVLCVAHGLCLPHGREDALESYSRSVRR